MLRAILTLAAQHDDRPKPARSELVGVLVTVLVIGVLGWFGWMFLAALSDLT